MKILFIYQYLGLGGVEAILAARFRGLLTRGVEVAGLFLDNRGGQPLFEGIESTLMLPASPLDAIDLVRGYRPDVLITLDTPSALDIARTMPVPPPLVYEVHTTYPASLRPLEKSAVINQINQLIVPSVWQRQMVRELIPNSAMDIEIVPNALEERFFQPAPPQQKPLRPIVAWVGRLDNLKNWRAFVQIAAALNEQQVNAEFWIVGGLHSPVEDQNLLWRLMVKNNLLERLRWLPAVPPEQMPRMLHRVRQSGGCVVSTSRKESFGMSILEAMACGCAVVVPQGGALEELAGKQERGLTYPLDQNEAACRQVVRLLNEPGLRDRLGEAGAEFARRYTVDAAVEQFLQAISHLKAAP